MQHYYAMIMAGGGGTRLWPMSRSDKPKQMLSLIEESSMFRVSVERLLSIFPPDHIYIVTGRKYVEALQSHTPEIPARNFIAEPYGKDSGPAAALGLTVIAQRDPQATVAILTADHHIAYKETFQRVLTGAYALAQQGCIVTLGISPSFPSTAFGYIRRGDGMGQFEGFDAYQSLGFTEKPDRTTAIQFIRSGSYSWNSGMFILRADKAMREFARQQPEMHAQFQALAAAVDTPAYSDELTRRWEEVGKISLDYAIMEGAQDVAVIPVDIGWSDVGSWDALYEVLELDEAGNGFKGHSPDRIVIDTKNTLVYSDKLTVTIGVENIVIVETDDVLMVCHKERTQTIKDVVNRLKAQNYDIYL